MCNKVIKKIDLKDGYIQTDKGYKIFPFEFEDLDKIYNNERFPDRIRREPRVLNKYNDFANIYILYGFKHVQYYQFKKGELEKISNSISEVILIPKDSVKAKISQLKSYIYENKKFCSYGLINIYKRFKSVTYNNLKFALTISEDLEKVKEQLDLLENMFPPRDGIGDETNIENDLFNYDKYGADILDMSRIENFMFEENSYWIEELSEFGVYESDNPTNVDDSFIKMMDTRNFLS